MKLLNKEQQKEEIKQIKGYRERILELEKENELMRDSLEWLQREINNLGKIIKTENGDKLILERPEKTKYVIESALNFTK